MVKTRKKSMTKRITIARKMRKVKTAWTTMRSLTKTMRIKKISKSSLVEEATNSLMLTKEGEMTS